MLAALVLLFQVQDTITVTATRTETRVGDTPASVVVLSAEDIATTPAATLDDALRQVPGFTLFRRSGSRTANPTSQGVSLRGIGASGASRAVVLDDGIPLNDPFGGWVYWGRVPRAALSRVEVLRGGASDLYGSGAMSGVVQFVRRRDAAVIAEVSGGSQSTGTASLFAATSAGSWRGNIAVDWLKTGGWVLVDDAQRGAVDVAADARHTSIDATVARGGVFLRASRYTESRNNGTPLQINDTTIRQLALGADAGPFLGRLYASDQDFHQTFSAIAANRNSERLTNEQRIPSRSWGGSLQSSHTIGARHALVGGLEGRAVRAVEQKQQIASAFLEDVFLASTRVSITAGLRYDDAGRNGDAWSPRLSVLYRANDKLALTASAYRAFRAPTLNELYRGFRVGNVLTNPNDALQPERLQAFEFGARSGPLRVNVFQMDVDDAVANVTISATPALITRQRQNLGSTRSRGLELEADHRFAKEWRVSGGYLFCDAVTSGGKRIPQVARHQATLQLARGNLGAQLRWSSAQFDDDLNQFRLRGYVVADLFASHAIGRGLSAILAAENITDRRVETAATPVITLGTPRSIRLGLRYAPR
ncbi:MAG TPA: TonB-dependent receptor [Thermoanaerobaculia bacterium]|nr:TonB-dependent receptor [Thermoanaerobaculia bacterium]